MSDVNYKEVLDFWFDPSNKAYWFAKDKAFDQELHDKFYKIWQKSCEGLLYNWRKTIHGRLAEIIVLDQFSRNLCRGRACAFSQDKMALILSQEAIKDPEFYELSQSERQFMLMPFMHSESEDIHKKSIILFEELGHKESTDFAYKHKEIIDRFGRYPHRNKDLGRESTEQEKEFLKQPGSSF